VPLWLNRFEEAGVDGLVRDRPRTGRPKRLDPEKVEAEIVRRTTKTKPPRNLATHWSTRLMAGELSQRQVKRLAVTSVDEPIDAITRCIERRNQQPKPFVWTASVEHSLEKTNKAKETLASLHYRSYCGRIF
jgi:hypothetical protein